MRLVTWNVNSIRARLPRLRELLDAHHPDVVCLQETKVASETFPHAEVEALDYRAVEHSSGRWNGVALLVPAGRTVSAIVRGLDGEPDPTEARWIEATLDGDGTRQPLRVVSTYVPNGREPTHPMFAAKLAFLERMRLRCAALAADGPTVVAGDLNIAPQDRDVWDIAAFAGATHVTAAERSRLTDILAQGFTDAYRVMHPDEVGFTWWDYRMGAFRRGMGMRIDLALVSAGVEVQRCTVDTELRRTNAAGDKPSDHAPVVVDVAITMRAGQAE